METKVNEYNWAELDFLINNFYEIVTFYCLTNRCMLEYIQKVGSIMSKWDVEYLKLCKNILENGYKCENRTGISTYKLPHQIFLLLHLSN